MLGPKYFDYYINYILGTTEFQYWTKIEERKEILQPTTDFCPIVLAYSHHLPLYIHFNIAVPRFREKCVMFGSMQPLSAQLY
jgi:hypothetical protein